MAIPLVGAAATAVARVVAKKLATRAVGGITGAGAKQVTPVYREMGTGSVTKIPQVTKNQQKVVNELRTITTDKAKSGKAAIEKAEDVIERLSIGNYKKPTIKINSNTRAR